MNFSDCLVELMLVGWSLFARLSISALDYVCEIDTEGVDKMLR